MPVEESRVEGIVDEVIIRLEQMPTDNPYDIYVWDDGTVTGPPSGDDYEDEKAIALFSPDDKATPRQAIRETLRRGFSVVDGGADQ